MRILKVFALALTLIFAAINFSSCGDKEKEPNPLADSLSKENNNLSGKLSEKEAALQEFITAFNDIQSNLNDIKEKEKIVTTASSGGDVKNKQEQIKEDIQSIYDLMAKNKQRINSLSKKLKDSNLKLEGMQQMIENLQKSIEQKDVEIADLKGKVESLNIELTNLTTNYKTVEEESTQKTEELNTAYYAIGTSKELTEKHVITKEGGFIGLGKTAKVKEDFNREYFTKVNIEQATSINIGSKKVKILTSHPKDSYKLVGTPVIEKIDITNPKDFWSVSKYLVIVIN
jgi:DNA repair exonuclease SbcCD ATPase subunit